jgi:hypothetical protein
MLCLDVDIKKDSPFPRIMKCYGKKGQEWIWKGVGFKIHGCYGKKGPQDLVGLGM